MMRVCAKPRVSRLLPATVSLGLAVLFALPTGVGLHCNGEVVEIIVEGQGFYLEDRSDAPGEINHWVYREANDRAGLQTGGEIIDCNLGDPWVFCLSDGCHHHDPDQLIW